MIVRQSRPPSTVPGPLTGPDKTAAIDSGPMPASDWPSRRVAFAILVAALGYFVDIYDLILFSIVRVASLRAIGVPDDRAALDRACGCSTCRWAACCIGGALWGVLGDKRGRLSVLFGSIVMYSLANIANGFVADRRAVRVAAPRRRHRPGR